MVFWYSIVFISIQWFLMEFDSFAGYYVVFDGIQLYSMELQGIQLHCRLLHGIQWHSMIFHVSMQDPGPADSAEKNDQDQTVGSEVHHTEKRRRSCCT